MLSFQSLDEFTQQDKHSKGFQGIVKNAKPVARPSTSPIIARREAANSGLVSRQSLFLLFCGLFTEFGYSPVLLKGCSCSSRCKLPVPFQRDSGIRVKYFCNVTICSWILWNHQASYLLMKETSVIQGHCLQKRHLS